MSRRRVGTRPVALMVAGGVAVVVAAAIAVRAGAAPYLVLGRGEPGVLVRVGTPVLRALADSCAVMTVGGLVFGLGFAPTGAGGRITARQYAALHSAGRWAAGWAGAALVLTALLLAGDSGGWAPLAGIGTSSSPLPQLLGVLAALEGPLGWLVAAGLAGVVALLCRFVLRASSAVGMLVVALLALLAPLTAGHSSSQTGHDLATAAIMVHVPAAVVWLGVLTALLRPAWRRAAPVELLLARYARLRTVCVVLLAGSGIIDAVVLAPGDTLLDTGYGALVLTKVALLGALAAAGMMLPARRRKAGGDRSVSPARWGRFLAGELVVLGAVTGVSVGLTALAPPAFLRSVTILQTLLGYSLDGPPTVWRLVVDWRVDVLFAPLAVGAAALYLLGVRRLRARGGSWPVGRTAAWLAGSMVLLVATSSGIGRYAAAMFSEHMVAHMLIAVVVPLLWALGGPVSLLRHAAAPVPPGRLPGPRDWCALLGGSAFGRAATQPVVALVLFVAAPFVLYLTGLFDAAVRFHWAQIAIDVALLVIGYLFAAVTVGVDPPPHPVPTWARLGLVLVAMPFDAVFAAVLASTHTVIGNGPAGDNMYQALDLPWLRADLLGDQLVAAGLSLGIGEVALLGAIAVLLWRWTRELRGGDPDVAGLGEQLRARSAPADRLDSAVTVPGRGPAGQDQESDQGRD